MSQLNGHCKLAWNHLFVGPGFRAKPCCRFLGNLVPREHRLSEAQGLRSLQSSEFLSALRTKMALGEKPEGCQRCAEEEQSGKRMSLREFYNSQDWMSDSLQESQLTYLELGSSGICNLACVMCGPEFSSRWRQDYQALHGSPWSGLGADYSLDQIQDEEIIRLRHVKFTGGEPLLSRDYREFLKRLVGLGVAKNIFLNYSTNMTILPDEELIDTWKKFERVEVAASIDGCGRLNDYVRFPSQWSEVERVAAEFARLSRELKLKVGLRATISAVNVHGLAELLSWWKGLESLFSSGTWTNATHVTTPHFLSSTVIPEEIKHKISKKIIGQGVDLETNKIIEHHVKHMFSRDGSALWPDFQTFCSKLDRHRGNQLSLVAPHLAEQIAVRLQ